MFDSHGPRLRGASLESASEKRRRLDELTSVLQRGDRLVVSELSRLGRSLGQIVTILDAFAKTGSPSWRSRRTSGSTASATSRRRS